MNPLSSSRTVKLFGEAAVAKIESSKVLVVGLGGVGSFAAEAIARGGVGTLTLLDDDRIEHSNLNRQLIALTSTIGKLKTEVMRDRILDINPEAVVDVLPIRYDNNSADEVDLSRYDYIVDAIDSLRPKEELIVRSKEANVNIISAMGTGNKIDPGNFSVRDIFSTSNCPLARILRKRQKTQCRLSGSMLFSEPCYRAERKECLDEPETFDCDIKIGTVSLFHLLPACDGRCVLRRLAGMQNEYWCCPDCRRNRFRFLILSPGYPYLAITLEVLGCYTCYNDDMMVYIVQADVMAHRIPERIPTVAKGKIAMDTCVHESTMLSSYFTIPGSMELTICERRCYAENGSVTSRREEDTLPALQQALVLRGFRLGKGFC